MNVVNIPFEANHVWEDEKKDVWQGAVVGVVQHDAHVEFKVKARSSSFNVIAGICTAGNFMMIPSYGVGVDLADPTDLFYNLEKIAAVSGDNGPCNVVDGVSAVYGLKALAVAGFFISDDHKTNDQLRSENERLRLENAELLKSVEAPLVVKTTPCSYCAKCHEDFEPKQFVHLIVCDNNCVCIPCSNTISAVKEPRLYDPDYHKNNQSNAPLF